MRRADFEELGDIHKAYESRGETTLMPGLPIMVRLDGRAFHTFARGLARPYDERMTRCMVETTKALVKESNALIGYTQSDEITLIIDASTVSGEMMFGGRVSKLTSILSAVASVKFNQMLASELPEKAELLPVFDCRVWQYPTKELCVESLIWREADATRNSLSMAASSVYSQRALQGVGAALQHDMLHAKGINWNDYPSYFKRGTYVRKQQVDQYMDNDTWDKIPDKHKPVSRVICRSVICEISVPPISQLTNLVGFVFDHETPTFIRKY